MKPAREPQPRTQPGHLAGVPRVEDGLVDGDDLAGDDVPVEGPRALPPQSREGRASLWVAEQLDDPGGEALRALAQRRGVGAQGGCEGLFGDGGGDGLVAGGEAEVAGDAAAAGGLADRAHAEGGERRALHAVAERRVFVAVGLHGDAVGRGAAGVGGRRLAGRDGRPLAEGGSAALLATLLLVAVIALVV